MFRRSRVLACRGERFLRVPATLLFFPHLGNCPCSHIGSNHYYHLLRLGYPFLQGPKNLEAHGWEAKPLHV